MLDTVLLDLDGTILDTTPLILASLRYATRTVLGRVPEDAVLIRNFGRTLEESLRALAPEIESVRFDALLHTYLAHNRAQHDRLVRLVPGAEEALRKFHQRGLQLGVVTSKRRDLAVHGLELFDLDSLLATVVAREDTEEHKPHPAPVIEALKRLRASPQCAVFIGDSPYDMQSGHAAGVCVYGLSHNTHPKEELLKAGATGVAADWPSLARWVDGAD